MNPADAVRLIPSTPPMIEIDGGTLSLDEALRMMEILAEKIVQAVCSPAR